MLRASVCIALLRTACRVSSSLCAVSDALAWAFFSVVNTASLSSPSAHSPAKWPGCRWVPGRKSGSLRLLSSGMVYLRLCEPADTRHARPLGGLSSSERQAGHHVGAVIVGVYGVVDGVAAAAAGATLQGGELVEQHRVGGQLEPPAVDLAKTVLVQLRPRLGGVVEADAVLLELVSRPGAAVAVAGHFSEPIGPQ